MDRLPLKDVLNEYKLPDAAEIELLLQTELSRDVNKIVVLDDDPTGIQTVHGVYVYTDWSQESIDAGLCDPKRMFYLLTNSRSFTAAETKLCHEQIAKRIMDASRRFGRECVIISRGDSTLRGHYPLETDTIRRAAEAEAGIRYNGEIIAPFFKEGGRYTYNNIHYVSDGTWLTPAGETEFAKDKTFGFHSSHLGEWIEEKSNGRYRKSDVTYISLESLRSLDIDGITKQLRRVSGFNKIVVNALDDCDLKVFCIALLRAMQTGKHFLFRTAASFPKILGGISDLPPLSGKELTRGANGNGGLIIVGSHVKKTTEQLERLKSRRFISFIEFNQHLVLDPNGALEREVSRVTAACETQIAEGKTVAVYTRRERIDLNTADKEDELKIAARISDAITKIVAELKVRPRFLIAKGGITSSDIGVKGLRVKKAFVPGQILSGIPVWLTGPESKFPGLPYVIFPGNVGEPDSLMAAAEKLSFRD